MYVWCILGIGMGLVYALCVAYMCQCIVFAGHAVFSVIILSWNVIPLFFISSPSILHNIICDAYNMTLWHFVNILSSLYDYCLFLCILILLRISMQAPPSSRMLSNRIHSRGESDASTWLDEGECECISVSTVFMELGKVLEYYDILLAYCGHLVTTFI